MASYDESLSEITGISDLSEYTYILSDEVVLEGVSGNVDTATSMVFNLGDSLGGTDAVVSQPGVNVFEDAGSAVTLAEAKLRGNPTLAEQLAYNDVLRYLSEAGVAEGLGNQTSMQDFVRRIASLVEQVLFEGVMSGSALAVKAVVEAAVFQAAVKRGFDLSTSDDVGVNDSIAKLIRALELLLDGAGFAEQMTPSVRVFALGDEGLGETETLLSSARLVSAIEDRVLLGGTLILPDGGYATFVLNTKTAGVSEYDNFSFNGFCVFGGRFLASAYDGIFDLQGSDDVGADINAVIRTGVFTVGGSLKKTVQELYLGYSSDGSVVLKAVYRAGGTKKEAWYELTDTNEELDTAPITIGKGAKSRYWQFELVNKSGADFNIDEAEMLVVSMSRRV